MTTAALDGIVAVDFSRVLAGPYATMESLSLGYDTLRELRPGLIYCTITGFDRGGGSAPPGYDLLGQAVGG